MHTQKPLFSLRGKVVSGTRVGRILGFPTANIDKAEYGRSGLSIPPGVYAGTASVFPEKTLYRAGIVVGPKEGDGLPKIEAHLLDFSGDLYGKELELSLFVYLRPYRNFKGEDALKEQIGADIQKVRALIVIAENTPRALPRG